MERKEQVTIERNFAAPRISKITVDMIGSRPSLFRGNVRLATGRIKTTAEFERYRVDTYKREI